MAEKRIEINSAKLVTPKGKNKNGWNMEISYTETTKDGVSNFNQENPANPHPDLITAFQKLAPHIGKLTEQYNEEGEIDIESIEPRGFSLSGKDDKEGITMTAQRTVGNNRSLTINTPLLRWNGSEDDYEDIGALGKDLDACVSEVKLYMDGKHSQDPQMELFTDDETEPEYDNDGIELAPKNFTDMLQVLRFCVIKDNHVSLPEKLDSVVHADVKSTLEGLGGKWKGGKVKAFAFESDPTKQIQEIIDGSNPNAIQLKDTPQNVANAMMSKALLESDMKILVTSADLGLIKEALHADPSINIDIYTSQAQKVHGLQGINIIGNNFSDSTAANEYDRIMGSMPFAKGADVDQVLKMYNALKPGGRLLALTSTTWTYGNSKKFQSFREWIKQVDAKTCEFENGAFSQNNIPIKTVMIIIDKL